MSNPTSEKAGAVQTRSFRSIYAHLLSQRLGLPMSTYNALFYSSSHLRLDRHCLVELILEVVHGYEFEVFDCADAS